MTKYESRTASFIVPKDQTKLDYFDELARDKRGFTGAIHFLIDYHQRLSPLVGSSPLVAEVLNNGKSPVKELIKLLKLEMPELETINGQEIDYFLKEES